MTTRTHLIQIPRTNNGLSTAPDLPALQQRMDELFARIDSAGEEILSVQSLDAGWGNTFMNVSTGQQRTFGAGLGFSYTDALLVVTRSQSG